jgi:hypothetical protein
LLGSGLLVTHTENCSPCFSIDLIHQSNGRGRKASTESMGEVQQSQLSTIKLITKGNMLPSSAEASETPRGHTVLSCHPGTPTTPATIPNFLCAQPCPLSILLVHMQLWLHPLGWKV